MYTKTAAARILTFATRIETVRELPHVIQVTYRVGKARCSTFVSKAKFAADFVEFRQAGAVGLVVTAHSNDRYTVYNPTKGTYSAVVGGVCDCEDHQQHGQQCKHIYAVLNHVESLTRKVVPIGRPRPDYFTMPGGKQVAIG
jgi:hypothetical protein